MVLVLVTVTVVVADAVDDDTHAPPVEATWTILPVPLMQSHLRPGDLAHLLYSSLLLDQDKMQPSGLQQEQEQPQQQEN